VAGSKSLVCAWNKALKCTQAPETWANVSGQILARLPVPTTSQPNAAAAGTMVCPRAQTHAHNGTHSQAGPTASAKDPQPVHPRPASPCNAGHNSPHAQCHVQWRPQPGRTHSPCTHTQSVHATQITPTPMLKVMHDGAQVACQLG